MLVGIKKAAAGGGAGNSYFDVPCLPYSSFKNNVINLSCLLSTHMPSGRKKSKICSYLLLVNVDNDTAGNV